MSGAESAGERLDGEAIPFRDSPYFGLDYYEERFGAWFFGRENERGRIITNLQAARLTLLHAESGVGKSSLLRAGVAWRLREIARTESAPDGVAIDLPVVFTSWKDDPVPALVDAVEEAIAPFQRAGATRLPRDRLDGALDAAAEAANATLFVILDQFEEYFLYSSREPVPERFADELSRCINRAAISANFLIAIREDAYAGLGDLFKGRIADVYGNYLHIEYLDRQAAEDAIRKPLDVYNRQPEIDGPVAIEDELVEAVLDQVRAPVGVATPLLQLVMKTIWDRERAQSSPVLRLATLRDLEGVEKIVDTHLGGALRSLPADERQTAIDAFDHLVTPSGGKIAESVHDLATRTGRDEVQVGHVLEQLDRARIVRSVPAPPGQDPVRYRRYEIFHDVLAPAINRAIAEREEERLSSEARAAEEQARRDRRRAGVSMGLAAISLVLLVIAIIAVVLARNETARARRAQRAAISYQLAREAQTELQSGGLIPGVLLSIEAERYSDTPDARYSLVRALAATEPMERIFTASSSAVTTVAFSPNGKLLASGNAGGAVVLTDEASGKTLFTLPGTSLINQVTFSPGGTTLASATQRGTVVMWDLATRRMLGVLDGTAGAVNGIAFSPDGRLLALGNQNGSVSIWNALTGRRLRTMRSDGSAVNDVAFSPDGATLAAAGADGTVVLWDPSTGRSERFLRGNRAAVNAVAYAPDGRTLAAASDDHTIIIWSASTGRVLHVLRGHTSFVNDLAFSPDGRTIASAGADHLVILWDAATGRELRVLRGHASAVDSVAFNPSGTLVASGGEDDLAIQWYVRAPLLERVLTGNTNAVLGIAVSRDGRFVASAGQDGTVRVWDARTGALLHTLRGHSGAVEGVAFSPDGKLLASADDDHTVIVWSVSTGRALRVLRGHTDIVYAVAFSPDDHTIASGGADDSVIVWNADTGQRVHTLSGHSSAVNAVAFSPNGTTLASASSDRTIILWNVATGRRLRTLTGDTAPVESVAFSPDGRELASASLDGTVMLWNVSSGRPLGEPLRGHSGGVASVAFAPGGRTLASGGVDGSVIVWDLGSRLGAPYIVQSGAVAGVAFAPGGRAAFSGSFDGTVAEAGPLPSQISATDVDRRLCSVVESNLTRAQWNQLVPGAGYQEICPGAVS
ncbi:MAG TPA: hypothetical protein VMD48_00310 [Solirubrobacteraceae bacterium]|nr:hypothetical protein [Solirubrobacteraceae bacterium]